jgi:Family of unknown function (DUF5372)
VTVTHPLHPLHGQQVEVVRVRRGADPDLIVRLPDGRHAAVARNWTAETLPPVGDEPSIVPPLLAVDGLRQLVVIIARIRAAPRVPVADPAGAMSTSDPPRAAAVHAPATLRLSRREVPP